MNEPLATVWEYWRAGGPLLAPLAAVCMAIWTCFFSARRAMLDALDMPAEFDCKLADLLLAGRHAEAAEHCAAATGLVPAAAAKAISAAAAGAKPSSAFAGYGAARVAELERDLAFLAAFTAAAPLLGLLGTVIGMIATFQAVAGGGGQTGSSVASGISQALITTQLGLVVAIPGLFALARLRRLLAHVEAQMSLFQSRLLPALGGLNHSSEVKT